MAGLDAVLADKTVQYDWLKSKDGACCEYVGADYTDAKYFGDGVGIGIRKADKDLVEHVQQGDQGDRRRRHLQEDQREVFPLQHLLRHHGLPRRNQPARPAIAECLFSMSLACQFLPV